MPGTRQVATARVIISANPDRITIAQDGPQGPEVVFQESYDPASYFRNLLNTRTTTAGTESYLTTLSGKQIAFLRDSSCGCGSRLKSWNPYKNNIISA